MARSARKALRGCQADFPRAASNSRSARWSAITTSVTNGSQNLGTGLSLFRGLPEAAALRLGSALTAEGSWPEGIYGSSGRHSRSAQGEALSE